MNFRNIIRFFSMCITWSIFSADLALSCLVEPELINHTSVKKKGEHRKKSHRHKKEQATTKIEHEQPKPSLTQMENPTTEIVSSTKTRGVYCLETIEFRDLQNLFQEKNIILDNMKITLSSPVDEVTNKIINDKNNSSIYAHLYNIANLAPTQTKLGAKPTSVTGKYTLIQNSLRLVTPPIILKFMKDNPASMSSTLSVERGNI